MYFIKRIFVDHYTNYNLIEAKVILIYNGMWRGLITIFVFDSIEFEMILNLILVSVLFSSTNQ